MEDRDTIKKGHRWEVERKNECKMTRTVMGEKRRALSQRKGCRSGRECG